MLGLKSTAARGVRASTGRRSRQCAVRPQALFGWGKPKDDDAPTKEDFKRWKEEEKEEAFKIQQELLAKRRTGSAIVEANERRRNVKATVANKKAERQNERDLLAQGIMPETLKNWKPYEKKEDAEGTSGIIVPLLPFGMRKYDEGERFDLRSPYADMGWVDPEETDMMAGIKNFSKKFLNFSGKSEPQGEMKPIVWASDYQKYKKDKDDAAKQAKKQKE